MILLWTYISVQPIVQQEQSIKYLLSVFKGECSYVLLSFCLFNTTVTVFTGDAN